MREIKFRAWDNLDCRYEYFTFKDMLSKVTKPSLHPSSCDWELEQFTGLHDKNGKEIYEGDIISHKDSDFIRVVKWSDIVPSFTMERSGFKECVWYNEKHSEIIGNIHENPELITV